jgi:predicted enzyme related to lactoylglutathione lyase
MKPDNEIMTKIDPIIAVKDIEKSANWYLNVFGFKRTHTGDEFAILLDEDDEVALCLHKWNEHEHPTMKSPQITPGNGLILYFRTESLDEIRSNVEKHGYSIEQDIHLSENSMKKEFSLRDLDGYFLTVSEFHEYKG